MAEGIHWEWRAFGRPGPGFPSLFRGLAPHLQTLTVQDFYVWTPGLSTNIKIRRGAEEGLKFKRLLAEEGALQCWQEDPAEFYPFPLHRAAWYTLAQELAAAGLDPGPAPESPVERPQLEAHLARIGCRTIRVKKRREARLFAAAQGSVVVEWAQIEQPQALDSIGLENAAPAAGASACSSAEAVDAVAAAVAALGLHKDALRVMSYMDAVAAWAAGGVV